MSKIVQLNGHDAEGANAYTGPARELTVDSSNEELRLHDGETPGGHRILNRDSNDQRYQKRSMELDGLLGWEPNQKGFLARLGTSSYELRKLTVNGAQLTLVNGNGYDGDPLLGLAEIITTPHTFANTIEFSEEIQGYGGFRGNVIGNLTGDVTGNVTGNLTGNATGDHSGTFTGSVDVSGGEIIFADGQIPLSALGADAVDYIVKAGLPVFSIVPYAGDEVDIPENWYLCDGTNGTPDLTDRFIMGFSNTHASGTVGGSATLTPEFTIEEGGAHAHEGTVGDTTLTVDQIPAHKHINGVVAQSDNKFPHGGVPANPVMSNSIDNNDKSGTREGYTTEVGSGQPHTHELTTEEGGAHSHTVNAEPVANLPPYFAMAFIMKGA